MWPLTSRAIPRYCWQTSRSTDTQYTPRYLMYRVCATASWDGAHCAALAATHRLEMDTPFKASFRRIKHPTPTTTRDEVQTMGSAQDGAGPRPAARLMKQSEHGPGSPYAEQGFLTTQGPSEEARPNLHLTNNLCWRMAGSKDIRPASCFH